MVELKPCPFCGARGDLDHCSARDGVRRLFWVECRGDECGISGRICDTAEAAAAAWNRRAAAGVAVGLIPPDAITVNLVRFAGLDKHKARECEAIVRQVLAAHGVTGTPARRETRPADPSEPEAKIARREGYDEGWNDCLSALGVSASDADTNAHQTPTKD